jgi:hypothetical protein
MQHRDVDVLLLYPLDLVAVQERFGSWMTQYAYANYITAEKLLERGKVTGKAIEIAGRRFTTLVALFEPFPSKALLSMIEQFAANGGRVIWSGPPPVWTFEGEPALERWQTIFGVDYTPAQDEGIMAPGKLIRFEGALAKVPPQVVLTDFLVDRIYPVRPRQGTAVLARVKSYVVGAGRGSTMFLGFRPRDDQSLSLGYDVRTWFDILHTLGAYPSSGRFPGVDDNTECLSRTGKYLVSRFPNGAVAVAPHLKELEEDWPGGFARDAAADKAWLEKNPLPPDSIELRDFKVNGHSVTYSGAHAVSFRLDAKGDLVAFAGRGCRQITINGRTTAFAAKDLEAVAWAPVARERRVPGGGILQIQASGQGTLRIPVSALPAGLKLYAEGQTSGSRGAEVKAARDAAALVIEITRELSGKWIYGVAQ